MTSTHSNRFLLHLADDTHIMGHRLGEWCGHGPTLEQDIALTNLSLDLIGQARLFYQCAAASTEQTEDTLAYLRDSSQYLNCLMAELPNGHFGITVLKVCFFSNFKFLQYKSLSGSPDKALAAIAEKSLKELQYHMKFSSSWVKRLGDGTTESHNKMTEALEYLWPFTGELFEEVEYEIFLKEESMIDGPASLRDEWEHNINSILREATLTEPPPSDWMQAGGKMGNHTEHLGHLLAEMQYLQRAYPDLTW